MYQRSMVGMFLSSSQVKKDFPGTIQSIICVPAIGSIVELSDLHPKHLEGKREGQTRSVINRVKENCWCIKISLHSQNVRTKSPYVDQEGEKADLESS